jgi:hypothetical protein
LSGDPAAWARQGVKVSGDFRPAGEGRGIELAGPNSRLELTFTGNRVDVIGPADAPPASATVLIDDRPPSAWPFNWAVSRPSAGPGTWFPAVNRVSLGSVAAQTEDWTLHFFDLSKDGKQYKFRLSGSITGPDGEGDASMAEFTSTSGRIRFLISDVSLPTIARVFKKDLPPEFDVKWKTYPLAGDAYQRASGDGKSNGDWQTIANDLPSAEHRLIIQPRGDGPIRIRGLEIHRPPFPATPDNLPPG